MIFNMGKGTIFKQAAKAKISSMNIFALKAQSKLQQATF